MKKPIVLIGRYVSKEFLEIVVQIEKVVSSKIGLYRVEFENSVFEELYSSVFEERCFMMKCQWTRHHPTSVIMNII